MRFSLGIIAAVCFALLCVTVNATAASVNIDLSTVTNTNAPLLFGESFDARASFTIAGKPIGFYSPVDGSPLSIGQYWEDTHRQTAMRYPLGPVNVWNWKATINPLKAPQPLLGNQTAQFGLDEFMEMAERNGMAASEVHMLINIYRDPNNIDHAGAVQDAVDLVTYLNKEWDGVSSFTGSNWEALRAENNHPEPYGVELFNLGNEPWGFTEYDYRTSLDPNPALNGVKRYVNDMADFVAAMKAVDPTIKITLQAAPPTPNSTNLLRAHAWDQTLVDVLGNDIYGLSVNFFYDSENAPLRGVNSMKSTLDHLDAVTSAHNQLGGNQLQVMVGEHAHEIDLNQNNQPIDSGDADFAMQWQGAVGTADFLMMVSNLDYLERAHYFLYGNGKAVWHPMRLDGYNAMGEPIYTVMPTAKLYEILGPMVLDEALKVTSNSPSSLDGESYSIRGGAFRSADLSQLTLVLVNRDSIPHEVDPMGLAGYSLIGLIGAQLLTSSGPLGETIDVASLLAGPNGSYTLPGLSIAIVQFLVVPEPTSLGLAFVTTLAMITCYARRHGMRRS